MQTDLSCFFHKYESLVEVADQTFRRVSADFGECVTCKPGCCDCCHAMFEVPLIEALSLHHRLHRAVEVKKREALVETAACTDRRIYRIKRTILKAPAVDRKNELLSAMSTERIRCPLLNNESRCELYEYRPITCRLYGIPTAIDGTGQTCGFSRFKQGVRYPTVQLEIFHRRLYEISLEVVYALGSSRASMAEMLVPVSTAMLTDFEEELLASGENEKEKGT
ncbi:MAG: YkgJ family cysteine cluster protein [Desulfobacteraceae bacterium]|nr:MAG: YkgJ family cysteine cluster protein [Desulfobacteraceae bacterium]